MSIVLPLWFQRLAGGLVVVLLALTSIGIALLLPYVPRLARAGAALPEVVRLAERAPGTLDQVERIDRNVAAITPPVVDATEGLPQLTPQLAALNREVALLRRDADELQRTAGPLTDIGPQAGALNRRLSTLQQDLRRLELRLAALQNGLVPPLTRVERPLRHLADTTGPLPESLRRLNQSTTVLQTLPAYLTELQGTLDDVARHVENLDRKTGPTPPLTAKP